MTSLSKADKIVVKSLSWRTQVRVMNLCSQFFLQLFIKLSVNNRQMIDKKKRWIDNRFFLICDKMSFNDFIVYQSVEDY